MVNEKVSKVSNAASYCHMKIGAQKLKANRIAEDAVPLGARFAEEILIQLGELAARRASEHDRKTLKSSDLDYAIKTMRNIIRVGKITLGI